MGLLIGRRGSVGFPNKNTYPILNRPLMSYPLLAALNSKHLDELYVSTDCNKIKKISNIILKSNGGNGAVRELLEDILNIDFVKVLY